MAADTIRFGGAHGGRTGGNPDGLKFRKVGTAAYEVVAPFGVLGLVGHDRDGSWWARPDADSALDTPTVTEGWRNRERAAHSLLDPSEVPS